MSTYYTGKGDSGSTSIISGSKILKDQKIIEAIGDVDELNSVIGIALLYVHDKNLGKQLDRVQNVLFHIGASLASVSSKSGSLRWGVKKEDIESLEETINELGRKLPDLRKFVIPAGSDGAVRLHFARAVARRAERKVIAALRECGMLESRDYENVLRYLNRLSSFFFVAALYMNMKKGIKEKNPTY
jgi:cob(I)alamin adenosyltransferase